MCRTDRENCAKNASEDCTCAESTGSGVHVDICLRGDEDLLSAAALVVGSPMM